eukprot:scaffold16835_cov60-Phaeocystis_antarctica.AAC.3
MLPAHSVLKGGAELSRLNSQITEAKNITIPLEHTPTSPNVLRLQHCTAPDTDPLDRVVSGGQGLVGFPRAAASASVAALAAAASAAMAASVAACAALAASDTCAAAGTAQ